MLVKYHDSYLPSNNLRGGPIALLLLSYLLRKEIEHKLIKSIFGWSGFFKTKTEPNAILLSLPKFHQKGCFHSQTCKYIIGIGCF